MNLAIFGLGYVGTVAAACLSENGHKVIGVDPNQTKVSSINNGRAPVIEPGVEKRISKNVARGLLKATTNGFQAVLDSELVLICVGTPSKNNGDLDLSYLRRVSQEIGAALAATDNFVTVAVRSTTLPGTVRNVVIPELETHSGKKLGEGFGVGIHPEFLREGSAVADFYGPPKIVFASSDEVSRKRLEDINAHIDAPRFHLDFETAEMVKYSDNVWHGLKVAFANEIGSICKVLHIDGQDVMNVFCQDRKLNISPSYLKPGQAFGGSCLPKDIRALVYRARSLDLSVPLIEAILPSNKSHLQRALDMIVDAGQRDVGILGLSFKPDTDDLRESPMVEIVERLIGKGYNLRIYDSNVNLSSLVGANREYVFKHLPHIAGLLAENEVEVTSHAKTVVVGSREARFAPLIERLAEDQCVIDFVRIGEELDGSSEYNGICW